MRNKNFSRKREIDSYLRNLDNNGVKHSDFVRDELESDFVPNLGNTSCYEKKKPSPISKRYQYFNKMKEEVARCQLCGFKPSISTSLVIDHEHTSKKIRGVLCQNCNHGLGKFMDNPDLLNKASDYIRNFVSLEALDYFKTHSKEII